MNKVQGSICFAFPVLNGVRSGALMLAYRFICGLVERGESVKIIDFKSGLLKSLLDQSAVDFDFVDLECKDWSSRILSQDVVFGFNNDIYTYPFIFENNPRLFFYDVYPLFWANFLRPKGRSFKWLDILSSARYINSGIFLNGIAVMEPVSLRMLRARFPGTTFDSIPVIPIAIDIPSAQTKIYEKSNKMRVTYVGRSEAWKIRPLVKFIKDVLSEGLSEKIILNIVFSNISMGVDILEKELGCKLSDTGMLIRLYENLSSEALEKIILEESDFGFAMGTSALEFARFRCPTLLADVSNNSFPKNYKYKWLHEVEPGCLGLDLDASINSLRLTEGVSLSQVLDDLSAGYSDIADRCYNHVAAYHSMSRNLSLILSSVNNSCLRSDDIKAIVPWVYFKSQELRRKLIWKGKFLERR